MVRLTTLGLPLWDPSPLSPAVVRACGASSVDLPTIYAAAVAAGRPPRAPWSPRAAVRGWTRPKRT